MYECSIKVGTNSTVFNHWLLSTYFYKICLKFVSSTASFTNIVTTVTQDTIRGTFEDITVNNPALSNAEYEVVLRDPNGNIVNTRFYNPRNANNGLIDFDFTGLNPNTDYNVQVRVSTDDGTFPLNSFNTQTQGKSFYCL